MRAAVLALVLAAGCASSTAQSPAAVDSTSTAPASSAGAAAPPASGTPGGTGPQVVKGGETFPLTGATVTIERVTYLNNPCPAGAQCITSGVIKTVAFSVDAGGTTAKGVLSEGNSRVINGVMCRVDSVAAGPQATIEASIPVAAAGSPQ